MSLFGKDKHFYHTEIRHEPYVKEVNITEKRAPTDESIKILNEMMDKAKSNIIHSFRVDNNIIKAIGIYYVTGLMSDKIEFHIKFQLNGKDYYIVDEVNRFEYSEELKDNFYKFGSEAIFAMVLNVFSKAIAQELMKQSPDFMQVIVKNKLT